MSPRHAALLSLLMAAPAWAGRRDREAAKALESIGPVASASQLPALAELLETAGWEPTPELSGAFRAGAIFHVTDLGHQLALPACFTVQPETATYTQAEVISQLQAGVGIDLGAGAASVSAGVVKKVKFGTPRHIALPALQMTPTWECLDRLNRAGEYGLDVATMYVVKEVLFAEITEQTCGRVDARGNFVGLGSAEASAAMACAQASLEPVAVAYRTEPVTQLPGVAAAGAPAPLSTVGAGAAAVVAPPGADYLAKLEALKAEAASRAAESHQLEVAHQQRVAEARAAFQAEAAAAWPIVRGLVNGGDPTALREVEAFVARFSAGVTIDGGWYEVDVPELKDAKRLLKRGDVKSAGDLEAEALAAHRAAVEEAVFQLQREAVGAWEETRSVARRDDTAGGAALQLYIDQYIDASVEVDGLRYPVEVTEVEDARELLADLLGEVKREREKAPRAAGSNRTALWITDAALIAAGAGLTGFAYYREDQVRARLLSGGSYGDPSGKQLSVNALYATGYVALAAGGALGVALINSRPTAAAGYRGVALRWDW